MTAWSVRLSIARVFFSILQLLDILFLRKKNLFSKTTTTSAVTLLNPEMYYVGLVFDVEISVRGCQTGPRT